MMENFNFENTWMVFSYSLITIFILLVIFTLFYLRKIKYEKKNLESLLSTSNAQRSEFEKKFKITRYKVLLSKYIKFPKLAHWRRSRNFFPALSCSGNSILKLPNRSINCRFK